MERDSIGGVVIKFAQVFMFILLVLFCYQHYTNEQAEGESRKQYFSEMDKWREFSKAHKCQIIEQGIYRGMFAQRDNLWLCDDGVKYYKPESFNFER